MAVTFWADAAVSATALVTSGVVGEETVVTVGAAERVTAVVTVAVSITVDAAGADMGTAMARAGAMTARARRIRQERSRFKESPDVIRDNVMPGDMRVMDVRTADPRPGQQGTREKKRTGLSLPHLHATGPPFRKVLQVVRCCRNAMIS